MMWALLAAAIAVAIAGGSAGGDPFKPILKFWKKSLRKYVKDDAAREQGEAVLDEYRVSVDELRAAQVKILKQMRRVHMNYDSTIEDYMVGVDLFGEQLLTSHHRMIDIAFEMRAAIGDDNHDKITAELEKNMRKAQKKHDKAEAKEAKKAKKAEARANK
jgi:hypothetical protein